MSSIGFANLNMAFVLLILGLSACEEDRETLVVNGCEIIPGTNCPGADLRNSDLSGADLSDANMIGADLSQANLSNANLRRADLSRARLFQTIFINTTCPDGTNSNDNDSTCEGHLVFE